MREPRQTLHRRGLLSGGGAAGAALLSGPIVVTAGDPRAAPVPSGPHFATDIRLPGMLRAVVARPPLADYRLAAFDPGPALAVKGVVAVLPLPPWGGADLAALGGVAVLARDTWSALRGRDALQPDWEAVRGAAPEAERAPGAFFVPETAEPLMETPCAIARADGRACTAWAFVREPERLRIGLAALLGLMPGAVTLHATTPACGAERASNPALVFEAALLARAAGAPVSLAWTRADDLPFRRRPTFA